MKDPKLVVLTLPPRAPDTRPETDRGPLARSSSLVARVRRATLESNLDQTGRRLRLGAGVATLLAGSFLLLGWALPAGSAGLGLLAGLVVLAGTFLIFEARASWCWLRALGFRTRW